MRFAKDQVEAEFEAFKAELKVLNQLKVPTQHLAVLWKTGSEVRSLLFELGLAHSDERLSSL